MKKAYEETIEDFRIDLCNTSWWRLKRIDYLQKQITMKERNRETIYIIAILLLIMFSIMDYFKINNLEKNIKDVRLESLQQDSASIQHSIFNIDEIIDIKNNIISIMESQIHFNKENDIKFQDINKTLKYHDMMTRENAESTFLLYDMYWGQHDTVTLENASQRY